MKRTTQITLVLALLSGIFLSIASHRPIDAAPVQNFKDSMSTSRLSYFARIDVGVSVNDTIIKIATNGNPSNSTANLFAGDTLAIGISNAGATLYNVKDIGNTSTIQIATGLAANNAWVGSYLVATSSAIHTISFSPMTTVTHGIWQFLIKASGRSGENPMDGMPDQMGFDLGATTPTSGATGLGTRLQAADVSCPWSAVASVGTTVVLTTANGVGLGATGPYHIIACALPAGGTNPVGTGTTGVVTIGRALTSGSQLINPAPALSHVEGRAGVSPDNTDVYNVIIRHAQDTGAIIDADTTVGKIAVVESVRVSAIVDPTLTFYIDNVGTSAAGVTRCGSQLGPGAPNTTATSVSFGPLILSSFNNLAQRFSCTTNAKTGYVIQVYEDGPLTNLNTNTTIPDTNCDGSCTTTAGGTWVTDTGASRSEFGYALEVGVTSAGTVLGAGTTAYRPFPNGTSPATIMSRTTVPTGTDSAYICYRATASNLQESGNYENAITFLATATF